MTNAGPPPTGGDWGSQNPSGQNPSGQNPTPPNPFGTPAPSAPGAYPPPAYGQPAFGQPAPGQPAYGKPAYGQPGYPPPAQPSKSKTPMIIIGAVIAAVVVIGIILAVTLSGGGDKKDEFTVAGAKNVAEQYFDDIADQDPAHAKTLLCNAQKSAFEDTLDGPNSDFDFTFTDITFKDGSKDGSKITVVYDLVGYLTDDKDTTVDVELTFELIDENGPKLCGEKGSAN